MRFAKQCLAAVSVLALLLGIPLAWNTANSFPSNAGTIMPTGNMAVARSGHTATLLPDGRVLIAGGMVRNGEFLVGAELYNPTTGTFSQTGEMTSRRVSHRASLLPDGKVLITGGLAGRFREAGQWYGNVLSTVELYDPATGRFTPAGKLNSPRNSHAAVRLNDGKVLLLGGGGDRDVLLSSAEVYDHATRTFTPVESMQTPRIPHVAILLKSGKVLVAGGTGPNRTILASAELYEPARKNFSSAGSMTVQRHKHAATLLADGRVLITGGSDDRDWNGQYATAEIYDPTRNSFSPSPQMNLPRFKHGGAMVLLSSGLALVAGGGAQAEVFQPATSEFRVVPGLLDAPWHFSTATPLTDGRVLIAGGYPNTSEATNRAWVYQPAPKGGSR